MIASVRSPLTTYLVVNGKTGCNLSKKTRRDAAENTAMRWRRHLIALGVPVYVVDSNTGKVIYEAP